MGSDGFDRLTRTDVNLFDAGIAIVAVVPVLLGAFWGAPLVARELEAGTYRLVWTRRHPDPLARHEARRHDPERGDRRGSPDGSRDLAAPTTRRSGRQRTRQPTQSADAGVLRDARGVPVAYAVFAVVLGVTLGAVLRRSLPAMAITLTVYVLVQIAVPLWVRPHLVAPTTTDVTIAAGTLDSIRADSSGRPESLTVHTADRDDWILTNETLDTNGSVAALPSWLGECLQSSNRTSVSGRVKAPPVDPCLDRLSTEGYRQRVIYQPIRNFWPIQWAETALYLLASLLLAAFCFWWTHTRLS